MITTVLGSNRWNVTCGANISHMCYKVSYDHQYGWGMGGFIGGGHEVNFNAHWSLMPQLEMSCVDNGAILHVEYNDKYLNRYVWRSSLNAVIPVTAGFRLDMSENIQMKISAGPYIQETLLLRKYDAEGERKVFTGTKFMDRMNFGLQGEIQVETGSHLAYTINARYPLLQEVWSRQTLTMSLGVRYYF